MSGVRTFVPAAAGGDRDLAAGALVALAIVVPTHVKLVHRHRTLPVRATGC